MDTKNVMMSALLFLVISLVPLVNGGCTSKFGAPKVEQVALDKVKVSWDGLVPNFLSCWDFFIIRYWEEGKDEVHDATSVGPLGANQFSTEIKVKPRQRYVFRLKTTKRNKYSEGGSWGQSSTVEFIANPNYDTQGPRNPDDGNKGNHDVDEKLSMPIEIKYYIIAICGVIGGLIVIGIIYKLVCKYACNKKSSADLEMSLDENNDTHKDLLTAE